MANQPAASWTVSEFGNSTEISVTIGLPDHPISLRLNPGGTELEHAMKERIRTWLQENVA